VFSMVRRKPGGQRALAAPLSAVQLGRMMSACRLSIDTASYILLVYPVCVCPKPKGSGTEKTTPLRMRRVFVYFGSAKPHQCPSVRDI
jgi:hypothetical protein